MPAHVNSTPPPPPSPPSREPRPPQLPHPPTPSLPTSTSGWIDGWMLKASGAEPKTVAGCCTTSWAAHEQLRPVLFNRTGRITPIDAHGQGRQRDIMFPAADSVRFMLPPCVGSNSQEESCGQKCKQRKKKNSIATWCEECAVTELEKIHKLSFKLLHPNVIWSNLFTIFSTIKHLLMLHKRQESRKPANVSSYKQLPLSKHIFFKYFQNYSE